MTKAGDKVLRGLREAVAHSHGEKNKVVAQHVPSLGKSFAVRVTRFRSNDPDDLRWDVQLERMGGWQTLAYHIPDRDDAIAIGRAMAAKYERELRIDEDEQ